MQAVQFVDKIDKEAVRQMEDELLKVNDPEVQLP